MNRSAQEFCCAQASARLCPPSRNIADVLPSSDRHSTHRLFTPYAPADGGAASGEHQLDKSIWFGRAAHPARRMRFSVDLHVLSEMRIVHEVPRTVLTRIQHIVVNALLTSYLFVGAVAHLEGFGKLFSFDTGPQKVEQRRPTQPPLKSVCWTQHKHIPPLVKASPLAPAVITSAEWPHLQRYFQIATPEDTRIRPFHKSLRLLSRAPPLTTATF